MGTGRHNLIDAPNKQDNTNPFNPEASAFTAEKGQSDRNFGRVVIKGDLNRGAPPSRFGSTAATMRPLDGDWARQTMVLGMARH